MIVLSDSGPLIALSKINYLYILNEFFSDIVIPQAVGQKLLKKGKKGQVVKKSKMLTGF